MPSSGLPMECFWRDERGEDISNEEVQAIYKYINLQAQHAMSLGMFGEWLESFVGAWNKTKNPYTAANAGIAEWDM